MPSILTTCKIVELFKTKYKAQELVFFRIFYPHQPHPPALQPSSADTHSCIDYDYLRFLLCRLGLTFLFSSSDGVENYTVYGKTYIFIVYSKLEKGEKFECIGPKVNF
jgi:hypothetical protein